MPTFTTNYNFNKPDVASPTDEDIWGDQLNANWDSADGLLNTATNTISRTENTSPVSTDLTDRNKILLIDATSGDITIDLLAAATAGDGFSITVKKTDATTNSVIIDGNASETIDGQLTQSINAQYDSLTLVCDGTNWFLKTVSSVVTGSQVLLQTVVTTGGETSVDLTAISDLYDTYKVVYSSLEPIANNVTLRLRLGNDTSLVYDESVEFVRIDQTTTGGQIISNLNRDNFEFFEIPDNTVLNDYSANGEITFYNLRNSTYFSSIQQRGEIQRSGVINRQDVHGVYKDTQVINQLNFYTTGTSQLAAGCKFSLYGIKR